MTRSKFDIPVIGLTGLPASGKSTLGKLFNCYAYVIDVDDITHSVFEKEYDVISKAFDLKSFRSFELARKEVASIVFKDRFKMLMLESIVNNKIYKAINEELNDVKYCDELCVLEYGPLHYYGLDKLCNLTICVESPIEDRLSRLAARKWTREMLEQREKIFAHTVKGDLYIKNPNGTNLKKIAKRLLSILV